MLKQRIVRTISIMDVLQMFPTEHKAVTLAGCGFRYIVPKIWGCLQ